MIYALLCADSAIDAWERGDLAAYNWQTGMCREHAHNAANGPS